MKDIKIDLEGILKDQKDNLQNEINKQMAEKITDTIKWQHEDAVIEVVTKFYEKEVKPEVYKVLKEQRDVLVKSVVKSVEDSLTLLGEAMTKKAIENISQSWTLGKITKELFD